MATVDLRSWSRTRGRPADVDAVGPGGDEGLPRRPYSDQVRLLVRDDEAAPPVARHAQRSTISNMARRSTSFRARSARSSVSIAAPVQSGHRPVRCLDVRAKAAVAEFAQELVDDEDKEER